jgi:hypothetical protein
VRLSKNDLLRLRNASCYRLNLQARRVISPRRFAAAVGAAVRHSPNQRLLEDIVMNCFLSVLAIACVAVSVSAGDHKVSPDQPDVKINDHKHPDKVSDAVKLSRCGTWMIITLSEDIRLEQRLRGAGEHHRQARFSVKVNEVVRGTGSVKAGDTIKIILSLHKDYISNEIKNGVKDNQFVLGITESQFNGRNTTINHTDAVGTVLLPYNAAQRPLLLKQATLPLFWSYDAKGKLTSFWNTISQSAPNPKFFDAWDLQAECPDTGMPAYSVGKAKVSFKMINPGLDYYDFKELKDLVPKYLKLVNKNGTYGTVPQKHVLEITVSNPTEQAITVPALRNLGEKVLWNNSVSIWMHGHGGKVMLNRDKIDQPTTAAKIEPGKSLTGQIDLLLTEGIPDIHMYGWGSGGNTYGMVALGNVSTQALDFSNEALLVWGVYNAHAPHVAMPICTTERKMNKVEIHKEITEEIQNWLKGK